MLDEVKRSSEQKLSALETRLVEQSQLNRASVARHVRILSFLLLRNAPAI